jgi:tetratricopeptide (TPR) repeat protein
MARRRHSTSQAAAAVAILAAVLASAAPPRAARGQSYGTELPFVLGTGARSSGMGAAAVTLADDATVQYYNPAGLGFLVWKEASVYRTNLFDSKSVYYALSYAHPLLNQGTFAVSLMRVNAGGVEERDENNQLLSSDLHSAQTRFLLGFARTITPSLAAGANLKIDNQSFGNYSASGVGLDVGLMATQWFSGGSPVKGIREGFSVRNLIEPTLKLDSEYVSDPMDFVFGVSALSGFGSVALVTSLDFVSPRYSPFEFRIGQEVLYNDLFALRLGFDDVTPTYGFGARYRQIAFDYAFRSEDLGSNHRISLAVKFGASVPQQRARVREQLETEVSTRLASRMEEMERTHIQRTMLEADSLYSSGDYEKAADAYEMVRLWDPGNERAAANLSSAKYLGAVDSAKQCVANEKYVEGLFYSNRALSFAPGDSTAASLAALCNERMQAAENSQAVLADLFRKSIDLYAERRYGEALSGFEEALRIAPADRLAQEYAEKCRVNIESVVRESRSSAAARAKRGDYEGALSALEPALEYRPNDSALLKEMEGYKRLRLRAEAGGGPSTAGPGAPAPDPSRPGTAPDKALDELYRRGMSSFNAGRFDDAIRSLSKVWAAQPDYYNVADLLTKAYLFVGMGLYSDNKYEAAIDAWQMALTVDPTNSKAKRYLSKAHEELQRLSGVTHGE